MSRIVQVLKRYATRDMKVNILSPSPEISECFESLKRTDIGY
jgi:hypothetical protein